MNRERIKTLILCILVAMSIVFTQRIWFASPIGVLHSEATNTQFKQEQIEAIRNQAIVPRRIVVSLGNGSKDNYDTYAYTVLSSDTDYVWNQSKKILKEYFNGDPEVTLISDEKNTELSNTNAAYIKYLDVSGVNKSLELEFGDSIPSIIVSTAFDTIENKIVRNIKEIQKILIPAHHRGIIYIIGKDNRIFEVKLPNYTENALLVSVIDELLSNKVDFVTYLPLFHFVDNFTLIPVPFSMRTPFSISLPKIYVESQIDPGDEKATMESSKSYFNGNFDFVKTIRETSGAVVYMYGYGEKGVRINNRGRLEYNTEIGNASSTNIPNSLDVAIDFILQHSDFPEGIYLKEMRSIDEPNRGYYFGFGYRIGGFPVEFESPNMKHPIEVEVYGTKVKSYRTMIRSVMNLPSITPEETIKSPIEIIQQNIHILSEKLSPEVKGLENGEMSIADLIAKEVELVRMVYFDTLEEQREQILLPTWKIRIKDQTYFFDSYTGNIINSSGLN